MQLLLSKASRIPRFQWLCQSCRGFAEATKEAKSSHTRPTASQRLREGKPARTRFAPSPTGYLHLGSLRTALFNYLVAKATGGQFLLRIEDTDQKRTLPDAEARLYQDLEWAGIQWDEGPKIGGPFGPYKQSERTHLYREHAGKLLESGNAYRCFCTQERLHTLAQHRATLGLPPDYDGTCRHISREESDDRAYKGEAHVVRLKAPDKYPVHNDLVYGVIRQRGSAAAHSTLRPLAAGKGPGAFGNLDDPVLLKTDGFPTYHLANVVDDHLMEITHVIRGTEWISSTPKHLAMYQAFGWEPPAFAHVGLLLDKNRQKLSKRTGSKDISTYRQEGVFPETLTNFVALLGWSHKNSSDIMSMQELIEHASMKYTCGDSVVTFEKLEFLQKTHAARYASIGESSNPLHSLRHLAVKPIVTLLDRAARGLPVYAAYPEGEARERYISTILTLDARNYFNASQFIQRNMHFFAAPSVSDITASIPKFELDKVSFVPTPRTMSLFNCLVDVETEDWTTDVIRERIVWIAQQGAQLIMAAMDQKQCARHEESAKEELRVKRGWNKMVHQYLRWAIAAGRPGLSDVDTMNILGRQESRRRLRQAERVVMNEWAKKKAVLGDAIKGGGQNSS
ncbi:hypothetical protein WAI453_008225 [Rhynchosporium graminicola]|uniref:Glutamate--tRNA ligase, mitochondrial n=1 Tax=Rhynchosporium graminicola TaxID=2792576 RepID=A0A1E1KMV4_9HELO|nr:related to glutamyl-tRNA synthetase [Rhynchosporium commune]